MNMTNEHRTETPSLADPLEAKMPEPRQDRYFTHGCGKETLQRDAADPEHGPHEFEAGFSGILCGKMVERPDGTGDECGEPVKSAIHDPIAYLKYTAELRAALAEWSPPLPAAPVTSATSVAEGQRQAESPLLAAARVARAERYRARLDEVRAVREHAAQVVLEWSKRLDAALRLEGAIARELTALESGEQGEGGTWGGPEPENGSESPSGALMHKPGPY